MNLAPSERTTDCHVHVFDPLRFPYASDRRYTPPAATVDDLLALHEQLGIERVVLVQPSVYGADNRCLLAALGRLGPRARGVAVIGDEAGPGELEAMHERGIRAARLTLHVSRESDPGVAAEELERLSRRLSRLPWIIQLYAPLAMLTAVADVITGLPQAVLIDHFGMASAAAGTGHEGFASLLRLLDQRNVWIKLSGPYQISLSGPGYGDVAPIARALASTAPQRTVWGSDWPHPGGARRGADANPHELEPFRDEDDRHNLGLLAQWFPDPEVRHRILVDNPARLFGFDA